MNRWAFVFSIRWARYLALAIVFAIGCGVLSWWQLSRREAKVEEIQRIEQNYDAPAVPLGEALPDLGTYSPDDEWLTVEATGVYDEQLVVRNRPFGGRAGFEVLAPLRLDDGSYFIVDRGWIPAGADPSTAESVPAAPGGEVTVTARLRPGEPSLPGGTTGNGVLASIELEEIERLLDAPVYTEAYGLVASEDPAPAEAPVPALRPDLDEGPHLSYAFQWVIFALIGFAGLVFAIRQEYRYLNADDPDERDRAQRREQRRRAKRTDADIEDELLRSR